MSDQNAVDFSDVGQYGGKFVPDGAAPAKPDFTDIAKFGGRFTPDGQKPDFSDVAKFGGKFTPDVPGAPNGAPPDTPGTVGLTPETLSKIPYALSGAPSRQVPLRALLYQDASGVLPHAPYDEIADGAAQMAEPDSAEKARGAGHIVTGTVAAASPVLLGLGVTAPLEAAAWYAISKGIGIASEQGAQKLGANPADAKLAGEVASAAPLALGAADILQGRLSDAIDAHNARAAKLIAQDAIQGQGVDLGEHIAGPEIPLQNTAGWKVVPNGASAKGRPDYLVVDANGKPLYAGNGRMVQDWLAMRGVERTPAVNPAPDVFDQAAEAQQAAGAKPDIFDQIGASQFAPSTEAAKPEVSQETSSPQSPHPVEGMPESQETPRAPAKTPSDYAKPGALSPESQPVTAKLPDWFKPVAISPGDATPAIRKDDGTTIVRGIRYQRTPGAPEINPDGATYFSIANPAALSDQNGYAGQPANSNWGGSERVTGEIRFEHPLMLSAKPYFTGKPWAMPLPDQIIHALSGDLTDQLEQHYSSEVGRVKAGLAGQPLPPAFAAREEALEDALEIPRGTIDRARSGPLGSIANALAAALLRRDGYDGAIAVPTAPTDLAEAVKLSPLAEKSADNISAPTKISPAAPNSSKASPPQAASEAMRARPAATAPAYGHEVTINVPGEQTTYRARYAVRELADVQTSHNGQNFEPNPAYEYTNDRDYRKSGAAERVVRQAAAFEPAYLLSDNPDAVNGPPIVDARGNVLGGNSRAMTLARVYPSRPEAAQNYRELLEAKAPAFGIDRAQVRAMKQPVLVRELATQMSGDDAQQAITDFNKTGTAALTSAERAVADARRVSSDTLDYLGREVAEEGEDGTLAKVLGGPKGPRIINRLVEDGVITPQERPQYLDERGLVTPEAKQRITRLVAGRLFDSPAAYENAAPELRAKLERVAGPLARVEEDPAWNLTPETKQAVSILTEARQRGVRNLDDLAAQTTMFGGGEYSKEALAIAKTLQLGPRKAADAFAQYASDAQIARSGGTLDFLEPPTPGEAFQAAFNASPREVEAGGRLMEAYESAPEDFMRQHSFFSRALKAPAKASLQEYQSIEEMARDAHARFQARSESRPGVVWLNRPAAEILRLALGDDEIAFTGTHLGAEDEPVIDALARRLERIPIQDAEARAGLESIEQALRTAFRRDGDVVAVVAREMQGPRRLDQTLLTRRHEGWHRAMDSLGINNRAFTADPLVSQGLNRLAQSPQYLKRGRMPKWSEIPAYIAAGQWGRLGYDLDQATAVFAKYLDLLEAKHGTDGVDRALEAAHHQIRSEIRGRERGRAGRDSVRDLQRGGKEPDTTAPAGESAPERRKGSAPGGTGKTEPGGGHSFDASEQPERSNLRLFGSESDDEVARTAAREEQLKKLQRSKTDPLFGPQADFFEEEKKDPQADLFLGSGLGAMQPYVERFLRQDAAPTAERAAELIVAAKKDLQAMLAPASVDPSSKAAALSARANAAELARSRDRATAALAAARKLVESLPEEERWNFVDRAEHGQGQASEDLDTVAGVVREMLDSRRDAIRALGTGKLEKFIENYFPRIWKQNERAAQVFQSRRPLEGSKSFLKQRTIATFKEGLEAGLTPAFANPIDMVLAKCFEMDKYLAAHRILNDLKAEKLLKYVDAREGQAPAGWQKIDDPIATVFGPSVQQISEYPNAGLWTALKKVANALGVRHERGFLNLRGAVGRATQGDSRIKTLHGTAEQVIAHEIGHQIDWLAGSGKKFVLEYPSKEVVDRIRRARRALKDTKLSTLEERRAARKELASLKDAIQDRKKFAAELRALADLRSAAPEYTHKREEKMAQLAEMWVGARELFERTAPSVFAKWKQFLDENPKLHALRDIEGSADARQISQPYDVGGIVIQGHWWAPEPAARILNNYLSPGLRDKSALFRAYLGAANLLNQAQLGFSAFHLGFTTIDVATSKLALGIYQIMHGDVVKGLANVAQTPAAPITNILRGDKMLKEWYRPGTQGERIGALIDAAVQAGGRAKMDGFYETQLVKKMMEAWRAGNPLGALVRLPGAAMEAAAYPIMQWVVPRQKLGVFADLAAYELERLGTDASDPDVQAALARAWDSVDNRLGQLVYDNLFWHKTLKDLAMASVRSVGWNLGTIREIAGAGPDTARFLKQGGEAVKMRLRDGEWGPAPDFSPRMAYAIALPIMAGLIGAIAYYLWHGHGPRHLEDYFVPKDARGHRWSLPTYMKDVYEYAHDPVRTVEGKIHPLLATMWEMLENKDFYGQKIRNPHHRLVKQAEELAKFVAKQFEPLAYRTPAHHHASTEERVLGFFGIRPAPKAFDQHARQ